MSQFFKIEKALVDAVNDLELGIPMSQPNIELSDAAKANGPWGAIHVLNAGTSVATLGDYGEDDNQGVLQVDINVHINTGSGTLLALCDKICSAFTSGKALQYSEQTVKITASSISGIRNVGGFARRSVSVRFYARTKRII
jgi:hypothetical protein